MTYIDEAQLELVTLAYFHTLGYEHLHGPTIAPDGEAPERQDCSQVVLIRRLRDMLVGEDVFSIMDATTSFAIGACND